MFRTLPPSGSPIRAHDVLKCLRPSADDRPATLRSMISRRLDSTSAFLFSTGRGAMTATLQAMHNCRTDPDRKIVIVPSYTCYSVPASVLKAGLDVLVCDVDPASFDYDQSILETVDFDKVLALVACNLYGIPNRLEELESIASRNGFWLIDDSAQALGATYKGRPVGSFGAAGILSFDKGKVITSINGGVAVSNDDRIAEALANSQSQLEHQTTSAKMSDIMKLAAYAMFLRPRLYWLPSNLPFLGLGRTDYDESFPVARYFDGLAPLAVSQLRRIDELNRHRRACAKQYAGRLKNNAGIHLPEYDRLSSPIFLRFPIRIEDQEARAEVLKQCAHYGCTGSYPSAIPDVPELGGRYSLVQNERSGGRAVANEVVTLPTHFYVRSQDIETLCDRVLKIVAT